MADELFSSAWLDSRLHRSNAVVKSWESDQRNEEGGLNRLYSFLKGVAGLAVSSLWCGGVVRHRFLCLRSSTVSQNLTKKTAAEDAKKPLSTNSSSPVATECPQSIKSYLIDLVLQYLESAPRLQAPEVLSSQLSTSSSANKVVLVIYHRLIPVAIDIKNVK
jgi:hypothetical protein